MVMMMVPTKFVDSPEADEVVGQLLVISCHRLEQIGLSFSGYSME